MARLQNTSWQAVEMRADVEAGIKELDAGQGIPHDRVFKDLLREFA